MRILVYFPILHC